MIFIKNKRIIEQQAAEIRMLSSQWQTQRDEIQALTQELDRTRAAADRQAIELNQRADNDRVVQRDLVKALAVQIASGYGDVIEIPAVPDEIFPELLQMTIAAKKDRAITPSAIVLPRYLIDKLQNHLVNKGRMAMNEDVALTFEGIRLVRK